MKKKKQAPKCKKCGQSHWPMHGCSTIKEKVKQKAKVSLALKKEPFSTSNYQEAEILQVKHGIVPVAMTGNILYGEERVYTFAISEEKARKLLGS